MLRTFRRGTDIYRHFFKCTDLRSFILGNIYNHT